MIRIGTAGWQYRDWEGIVYPKPRPRGFDPLSYLAGFFDLVEINSSFYGPPQPGASRAWVARVADHPDLRFTAKLWKGFTHERNATASDEKLFKDGIQPLADAGRLGALLIQFPWSFKNEPENRSYIWQVRNRFADYPLVLEVRHSSWIEPQVLDALADLGVGLCNIDQPLFHRSVKPTAHSTSGIGYVRLHGRNYQQWFSPKADVRARYDFLYSVEQLEPWVDRIRKISHETRDTYVVTNNHNLGKATVNAFELQALFGKRIHPPPQLVHAYPELEQLAMSSGSG